MTAPPSGRSIALTFIALVVLAAVSWIAAVENTGSTVALAIAGIKALAIGLVFMELVCASTVDRVIAVIAVFFVILLCLGSLADVAFR